MELKLNLVLSGGNANLHASCNSFEEMDAIKGYLVKHGLLGSGVPPQTDAGPTTSETQPASTASVTEAAKAKRAPKATATPALAAPAVQLPGTSIDEVTGAVTEYANKFGVQEALMLNQRFGVKKIGELKTEQYGEYAALVRKCIEAGTPASQGEEAAGVQDGPDMTALV